MSRAFFDFVLTRRWLIVLSAVIVIGAAVSGVRFLSFSNDYRMFFSEDNPQLQAFEALQDTYSKTDNVLFVLAPKDGNVFNREVLDTVEWLTRESWQIPFSIRVDSISNFQYTSAEGDDLLVRDLVENARELTDQQLLDTHEVAVNEPLLVNRIISPSGHVTGVNVTIQLQGKELSEVPEVATFARDLVQQVKQRNPDVDVYLTGMVIMNNAFPEASQKDMKTLYPIMFAIILLVLGVMLRNVSGTFATALVIFMTIGSTLGLTGWLGMKMSPPTTSVPVMVMTLAVADCVHVLVSFLHGMRSGLGKAAAMAESLRINVMPIFLTTVTTVIGFLSLNFSDAPPFRDLGNMAAMGVTIAFLLSVTFLPAIVMLLPIKEGGSETRGQIFMDNFGDFVVRNKQRLFWGMAIVILLVISQVPRNVLNDVFVEYFDESIAFRADTDFAAENLTGIYMIEYSVPAESDGGVTDPKYLRNLEKFANWYRQQPNVMHVNVLTDIMKRLNKKLPKVKVTFTETQN